MISESLILRVRIQHACMNAQEKPAPRGRVPRVAVASRAFGIRCSRTAVRRARVRALSAMRQVDGVVAGGRGRADLMRSLCPLLAGCLYWRTAGAQGSCKYQAVDFAPLNKAGVSSFKMVKPAACEARRPLSV